MKAFYIYMMTNQSRVVLYTGITNSLLRRVWQHQSGEIEGFAKSYEANRLVYRECFDDPRDAIAREKEMKGWRREKKMHWSKRLRMRSGRICHRCSFSISNVLACFSSDWQATTTEDSPCHSCVFCEVPRSARDDLPNKCLKVKHKLFRGLGAIFLRSSSSFGAIR